MNERAGQLVGLLKEEMPLLEWRVSPEPPLEVSTTVVVNDEMFDLSMPVGQVWLDCMTDAQLVGHIRSILLWKFSQMIFEWKPRRGKHYG